MDNQSNQRSALTTGVAGEKDPKSGWAIGLTGSGYPTAAYHFYPAGQRSSVCTGKNRRSGRTVTPKGSLKSGVRLCKGCQGWVDGHPDGGLKYDNFARGRNK